MLKENNERKIYRKQEVFESLLEPKTTNQDGDSALRRIIKKQPEIKKYKKIYEKCGDFNDFMGSETLSLGFGILLSWFIMIFWGKINTVPELVFNSGYTMVHPIFLLVCGLISAAITLAGYYLIVRKIHALILKAKIEKAAIKFAERFGFDICHDKTYGGEIGRDITFIINETGNYLDKSKEIMKKIIKQTKSRKQALQICKKLLMKYEAKNDYFNAFLYARAMKEMTLGNTEKL